jgi:hypothetical protein
VAVIIVRYLPVLLLAAGVLLLLLTGRPLFTDGALSARQSTFRSLAVASPVLEVLIGLSVVGKPFLEHLQKNDWHSDLLAPEPLFVIVAVFEVSLFAMIGGILFFFYRAIRNINFFNGRRVRAPYSALFMIVPIVNVVVAPYVQYFAYHRSRVFAWPAQASALRDALLVFGTFALLLVTLTCGYAGDEATAGQTYDAASILVIGTLTGLATGILQARIVDGIARSQQAYAAQIGALGGAAVVATKPESRTRRILQSASVGILLLLALLAALNPSEASHVGRLVVRVLGGA